jgi:hypothetical protein
VWKSLDIFFPSFVYPSALKIKVAGFLWQEDCYPIASVQILFSQYFVIHVQG